MSESLAFLDGRVLLHPGDCREVLRGLADCSIDSVVTDPPYALVSVVQRFGNSPRSEATENVENPYGRTGRGFMGQKWDTGETAFAVEFWAEVLRVLKPGGHVVGFGGTRAHHQMWSAIEAAGFEIRDSLLYLFDLDPIIETFFASLDPWQQQVFLYIVDQLGPGGMLAWVYGTGFPKSHDVSKGIDKHLGAKGSFGAPKTEAHRRYVEKGELRGDRGHDGWQRPWMEDPEAVANAGRQYLPGSPEGRQFSGWGTALKPAWEPIVLARKPLSGTVAETVLAHGTGALNVDGCRIAGAKPNTTRGAGGQNGAFSPLGAQGRVLDDGKGRWPANIVHDGSEQVATAFPQTESVTGAVKRSTGSGYRAESRPVGTANVEYGDAGSAARFYYSAKADADDRLGSKHPTVKPVDLMQWLCRMVTPPGGTVLDPFAGTGTTGEAAFREGFRAVLIEREEAYQADIARRMDLALAGPASRKAARAKARATDDDAGPLFAGEKAA